MNETVYLINAPTRAYSTKMPIGLMYISSYLTSKKIKNEILDFKTNDEDEALQKILEVLGEKKPKIIGVGCLCTEIAYVNYMCNKIKEILPKSKIVLGGAHPTNYPDIFLKENKFDFIVIGEGEITFYELCKLLLKKDNLTNKELLRIKGLAWRDKKKNYFSKPRQFIENLDDLPMPAYDKINMEFYAKPSCWEIRSIFASTANVFTSRGCPFRCKYCVAAAVFGKKVRYRSPKLAIDEIELLLKKYHFDAIYFYDETFTIDKQRIFDICNEIKKRRLKFIWGCETRTHLVSEDMLMAMRKAGCIQIDFGVESCSKKMLDVIQKDLAVDSIIKAIRLCKKTGIRSFINLMTNLPGETKEDLQMSIDVMKREKPNVIIWNVTVPYPGTNMGDVIVKDSDSEILNRFPSKEAYNLLEKKYKLAAYDYNLEELVYKKLYKLFFHPRKIYLNFKPSYIGSFIRFINFIVDWRYMRALLKSKRKWQYFKELFHISTDRGKPKIIESRVQVMD